VPHARYNSRRIAEPVFADSDFANSDFARKRAGECNTQA
jgi:hypothetical protein